MVGRKGGGAPSACKACKQFSALTTHPVHTNRRYCHHVSNTLQVSYVAMCVPDPTFLHMLKSCEGNILLLLVFILFSTLVMVTLFMAKLLCIF